MNEKWISTRWTTQPISITTNSTTTTTTISRRSSHPGTNHSHHYHGTPSLLSQSYLHQVLHLRHDFSSILNSYCVSQATKHGSSNYQASSSWSTVFWDVEKLAALRQRGGWWSVCCLSLLITLELLVLNIYVTISSWYLSLIALERLSYYCCTCRCCGTFGTLWLLRVGSTDL